MNGSLRLAVVLAVAVLALAGCSGGDGEGDGRSDAGPVDGAGRPSEEAIAAAIEDGMSGLGVAPSEADCAARLAVDSDMSDEAIARYLSPDDPDFDDDYTFTARDSAAFDELLASLTSECGYVQPGG